MALIKSAIQNHKVKQDFDSQSFSIADSRLIPFAKYSGCGNDFVIIDNRAASLEMPPPPSAVRQLCHRHLGIGADGLIFLEKAHIAENSVVSRFKMRIFNADGSEAEMCGNGLRCLARFIYAREMSIEKMIIETMHQQVPISLQGSNVHMHMPPPKDLCDNLTLDVQGQTIALHYLDTGVPHAVLFVDHLDDPRLFQLAPHIRYHKHFHPKGTNVDFASILSDHAVAMRTYERGVEQETLACGTGAMAVALTAYRLYGLKNPIEIHTASKDILQLDVADIHQVSLSGPAVKVFHGEVELESFGFRLKTTVSLR